MRKIAAILFEIFMLCGALTASASIKGSTDTISVRRAFIDMPNSVLEIIPRSTRQDMLAYYDVDSLWRAPNAMEGISMIRKMTSDFLEVEITPVSRLQIKILPYKNGNIVGVGYTISTEGHAPDTELRFFDPELEEIPVKKIINEPDVRNFFDITKGAPLSSKELDSIIPFPTVLYQFSPDSPALSAALTVEKYLPVDTYKRLSPYFRKPLRYQWHGGKYVLAKN